jgi:hypothetical protein
MKLSDIKINPKNPRIIKDDRFKKLVKSIDEFPKMMSLRPIIVDSDGMVLGGNMRLKVLQHLKFKEIPDEWVKRADELTEEEKQRFIVSDNVGFGDWNWDDLSNDWDAVKLEEWGMELPGFDVSPDQFGEGFGIPDGDKAPFQQMTFTLADEQAILIQNCIGDVKKTDEYKYMETAGNENSNGNALYLIVSQWDAQRK